MSHELTDQELKYASPEDIEFFDRITEGLPTMAGKSGDGLDKFGHPIPYHSGPHLLRHFRNAIEIVKPKKIFEIGFNMGHSAAMWLELCDALLYSCDVSQKDETIESAQYLYYKYLHRMGFLYRWELGVLKDMEFDLAFIDAAHDEENITNDIELCERLKIPYLLFDDWYPRYGETQKAVAKFPELELVKDMNNLRLYKVNYGSSS